jgi:hypothetical protein
MDDIKVMLFIVGVFVSLIIGVMLTHIPDDDDKHQDKHQDRQQIQDIDLELGLNKNKTPCEYLRNFTVEILENDQPIMNIDTQLRQRITWVNP